MTIKEALKFIEEDGINLGAGDYVEHDALKVAGAVLRKVVDCPTRSCYGWCGKLCPLSIVCAMDSVSGVDQMYHYVDGRFKFIEEC